MASTIVKTTDFTKTAFFLFFILCFDLALFIFDVYLESGGMALVLSNLQWPNEVKALFALAGINADYLKPSLAAALVVTGGLGISTYCFVCYGVKFYDGVCSVTRKFVELRLQGNPQSFVPLIMDEVFGMGKTIILFVVPSAAMFFYVFPSWTLPIMKLMLATKIWENDFKAPVDEDSIASVSSSGSVPDLYRVMGEHEGEFFLTLIECFPYGLLMVHFVLAFLTEGLYLQAMAYLAGSEGWLTKRWNSLKNIVAAPLSGPRRQVSCNDEPIRAGRHQRVETQGESDHSFSVREEKSSCETEKANDNIEDRKRADNDDEPEVEDIPVRVIGGSETITPAEAMKKPDLYAMESQTEPEDHYVIYTREFYNQMNGGAC